MKAVVSSLSLLIVLLPETLSALTSTLLDQERDGASQGGITYAVTGPFRRVWS